MKLGLALSGGGIKGAAHIGVLQVLKEEGINVDIIGGTSIGSIVAALYAMEYTPKEMLKLKWIMVTMITLYLQLTLVQI